MPKTWQEIEFQDYKERQVRRRSQRTRELEQLGSATRTDRSKLLRVAVGGTLFLGLLAGGILGYQFYSQSSALASSSRSVLRVQSASGEAEVSSGNLGFEPLKTGMTVASGSHVRTGKNGKIVLRSSIPDSRVVIYEGSTLIFEKVQLSQKNADSAVFNFEAEKGEIVFDFQRGAPILKVVLPMVTVWSQLARFKAKVTQAENRVLVTRFAVQCEDRADPAKKVVVPDAEELVSTYKETVPKPRGAGGANLRERWD